MRFHELGLAIDKQIELAMIGQDYKKHAMSGRLIGFQKDHFLMVALPDKSPQVLLREGLAVSVSFTTPLGSVRFDSQIEQLFEQPLLHIRLEYPPTIEFKPVRTMPRIKVDTAVEIIAHTGMGMSSSAIAGRLIDISEGGLRLLAAKELTKLVTTIDLSFSLSDQVLEKPLNLSARLRNKAARSDQYPEYPFAYGVQFFDVAEIDRYFLRAYCLAASERGRAVLVGG